MAGTVKPRPDHHVGGLFDGLTMRNVQYLNSNMHGGHISLKSYRFGHPGSGWCELQQNKVSQADGGCSERSQQGFHLKKNAAPLSLGRAGVL